jgi:hypothetical protein
MNGREFLNTLDSHWAVDFCAGQIRLVADVDAYQKNRAELSTTIHEEAFADLKCLQMEQAGYRRAAAQTELAADLAAYHLKPPVIFEPTKLSRPPRWPSFITKEAAGCRVQTGDLSVPVRETCAQVMFEYAKLTAYVDLSPLKSTPSSRRLPDNSK